MSQYTDLWRQSALIIHSKNTTVHKMQTLCNLLGSQIETYDWVGFYLSDLKHYTLNLGPFYGAATEHRTIAFGKGICGQAAESKKTFVINNVENEKNYISCSIHVKSEIVVPIIKNKRVVGQIDVDSHRLEAFTDEDRQMLEKICQELATYIK